MTALARRSAWYEPARLAENYLTVIYPDPLALGSCNGPGEPERFWEKTTPLLWVAEQCSEAMAQLVTSNAPLVISRALMKSYHGARTCIDVTP